MRSPEELAADYVEAHNDGVRSGNFQMLSALLLPTATMRFQGLDVGPFDNAVAILQAFRHQPPTDELVVTAFRGVGQRHAEATYAWAANPGKQAGRIRISTQRGFISAIRIEAFS